MWLRGKREALVGLACVFVLLVVVPSAAGRTASQAGYAGSDGGGQLAVAGAAAQGGPARDPRSEVAGVSASGRSGDRTRAGGDPGRLGGSLPFGGLDLAFVAGLGIVLLAMGATLRWVVREPALASPPESRDGARPPA